MALSNQQFIISRVWNQDVRSFQHVSSLKTSTIKNPTCFLGQPSLFRLRMTCASASACWTARSPWNRWWLDGGLSLGLFLWVLPEMEEKIPWDFPYRTTTRFTGKSMNTIPYYTPNFLGKWSKHHSPLQSDSFYSWYEIRPNLRRCSPSCKTYIGSTLQPAFQNTVQSNSKKNDPYATD